MTVKEASQKFNINEKEIRKRNKDGMILGTYKEGVKIIIPDNTTIIPSKNDIKAFLFQILKYKNTPNIAINRSLCPDEVSLYVLFDFLYKAGYIGEATFTKNIKQLFDSIILTDKSIQLIIGENNSKKLNDYIFQNLNVQFAIINL